MAHKVFLFCFLNYSTALSHRATPLQEKLLTVLCHKSRVRFIATSDCLSHYYTCHVTKWRIDISDVSG